MNTDIDGLLHGIDLVDLVMQAGGKPRRSGSGGNDYRCACPLHGGDNPTSFSITAEGGKQRWRCFSHDCGAGDAIDFVMKWRGLAFLDAVNFLGGGRKVDRAEMAKIAVERAERAAKELEAQIAKAQDTLAELRRAQSWIRYHDQLEQHAEYRQMWHSRGIPEVWQDLWYLGYDPRFVAYTGDVKFETPTLSIPIFQEGNPSEPISLRHRLLSPIDPQDKYRPERSGLKAVPFVADPENKPEYVLVVEGEIKAMVAYICLDSPKWQVFGIPGKKNKRVFSDLLPALFGRQVVICMDPDALEEAEEMAKTAKGRLIEIPRKIDDAINDGQINTGMLRELIRTSRKVL